MRLKKRRYYFLFYLLLISIVPVYAQPSPKICSIDFNFYISDKADSIIKFNQKDSTFFNEDKYTLKIESDYFEYDYGKGRRLLHSNGYYFTGYNRHTGEVFCYNDGVFKLKLLRYNIKEFVSIIQIQKSEKNMFVYLRFNEFKENKYNINSFEIPFQEGIFEVNDPKNPKLIAVKEDDEFQ